MLALDLANAKAGLQVSGMTMLAGELIFDRGLQLRAQAAAERQRLQELSSRSQQLISAAVTATAEAEGLRETIRIMARQQQFQFSQSTCRVVARRID